MNTSLIWSLVRELLQEKSPIEIESGRVGEVLGRAVSIQEIQSLLSHDSDIGPCHCRLVDVVDTHHWTLRFWSDKTMEGSIANSEISQSPLRAA